jgi:rare lipoprotein A (peptidoglycan hydrolase)
VTASVGIRAAALAAVALVAVAIALAYQSRGSDTKQDETKGAGVWYTGALAAPYTAPTHRKSACGVLIDAGTVGVAHPVLPCGVKLYVQFHGKTVLTHVIDRGRTVPGREFDLTPALAKLLGVQGTQAIEWRFAR